MALSYRPLSLPCGVVAGNFISVQVTLNDLTATGNGTPCDSRSVVVVVVLVAPFEIVSAIIALVLVLVVYLWEVVWIRNKSLGNEPMHQCVNLPSLLTETNKKVVICAILLYRQFNSTDKGNLSVGGTPMPIQTANSPKVTYLVNTLVAFYRFPLFFHGTKISIIFHIIKKKP